MFPLSRNGIRSFRSCTCAGSERGRKTENGQKKEKSLGFNKGTDRNGPWIHLDSTKISYLGSCLRQENALDLVSLGFTWSHLVSLAFTWFHLVSLGFTWFNLFSLGFTWFHSNSFEFTWFHLVSLDFTWLNLFHLVSPGFTWFHLNSLDFNRF